MPSISSLEKLTNENHPILQPWRASDQSEYEFSVPAHRLVPRDDPTMLRPVLFHNDLDVRNVMVNDGIVSGIIDWELCPNFTLS
ncbi:hypothetical protein JB92DRAFT_2889204 [Gautieria morchelliformis]|nr:hypothetical protein JB92DRAFT_2889204 [Gautieria morchelliformis]